MSRKTWIFGAIFLLISAPLYFSYFLSEKAQVLRILDQACELASIKKHSHPFSRLEEAQELGRVFTKNLEILVISKSGERIFADSREQLAKHIKLIDNYYSQADFLYRNEEVLVNGDQAEVKLQSAVKATPNDQEQETYYTQNVNIKLRKENSQWMIASIINPDMPATPDLQAEEVK